MDTAREQALISTRRTREEAERLLASLIEAQAACDAQLAIEKRSDMVRKVKGRTSLEEAIDQTRRMIDVLRRAEEQSANAAGDAAGPSPSEGSRRDGTGQASADAHVDRIDRPLAQPRVEPSEPGEEVGQSASALTDLKLNPRRVDELLETGAPEEEPTVAGVLRPAASGRSHVMFGMRTSTRWGATR